MFFILVESLTSTASLKYTNQSNASICTVDVLFKVEAALMVAVMQPQHAVHSPKQGNDPAIK